MSFLLALEESQLNEQLIPILESFEADIAKAAPLFRIEGERLQHIARTLPQHQAYYGQRSQEAKHLVKWLENYMAKTESRLTKNYLQGQRALGVRETSTLIAGEKDMVEQKQLIIEASLMQHQLSEIVEAFKQMGWMLQNITKLHVASIQEVLL